MICEHLLECFIYHKTYCEYAFTFLLGISVWRRKPLPVPWWSICWGHEEDGGGGHSWSCPSLWECGSERARKPAGQSFIRIILTSKNWWYILSQGILLSCLFLWNADCVWWCCRLGNIWAPARPRTSKSLLLSVPSAGEKYNRSLTVHSN